MRTGILFSHKQNKVVPFAVTRMDLEVMTWCSKSYKGQVPYDFTRAWNPDTKHKWTKETELKTVRRTRRGLPEGGAADGHTV